MKAAKAGQGSSFVGQCGLGLGDVSSQALGAEPPKELLLARVATVQGPDPDPGAFGHHGDGRIWIFDEHLAGGLQDQPVVASRLGLPAAQACRHRFGGSLIVHEFSIAYLERNSLFRYNNGTERNIPLL